MGILVIGMIVVDIKGYPEATFIPTGRNVGRVERLHGGVGRNVAEDIANCELRPTLVSLTDESGDGEDVLRKLRNHKVNTDYIRKTPDGLGTWLAVFDNAGDVAASISKRPDMGPLVDILDSQGDEIFSQNKTACKFVQRRAPKFFIRYPHSACSPGTTENFHLTRRLLLFERRVLYVRKAKKSKNNTVRWKFN